MLKLLSSDTEQAVIATAMSEPVLALAELVIYRVPTGAFPNNR